MKNLLKISVFGAAITALYIYSVLNTTAISQGVLNALKRCINIIIPSLFFYIVLSGIVVKSGIYGFIFKPFCILAKYIFRLPTELFFVFVLGNICGYPIGISLIDELYKSKKISRKTALCLSCSSFGGGPSFIIGIIGGALYQDEQAGVIVFLSCLAANFLVSVVLNRILKPEINKNDIKIQKPDIMSIISGSANSLFKICAAICAFSAVCIIFDSLPLPIGHDAGILAKSILELTTITSLTSPNESTLCSIAAIVSFGGICIFVQLKSISKLSLLPLLISRIFTCAVSAACCKLFIILFDFKAAALASSISAAKTDISGASVAVTIIAAVFFIFAQESRDKGSRGLN